MLYGYYRHSEYIPFRGRGVSWNDLAEAEAGDLEVKRNAPPPEVTPFFGVKAIIRLCFSKPHLFIALSTYISNNEE
jgi:hypothetical protein